MSQVNLIGQRGSSSIAAGTTLFYAPGYGSAISNATESVVSHAIRNTGTWSKLFVNVGTNDRTGAGSLKWRKNDATYGNQAITIGAGVTGELEDSSNSDTNAAGDAVAYELVVGSGGTTFIELTRACLFDSALGCVQIVTHSLTNNFNTGSTTQYFPLLTPALATGATESNAQIEYQASATWEYLMIRVSANARVNTTTFTSRINGAPGNLSIAVGAGVTGELEDTSHSDAIVQGSKINFAITTGTGGQTLTWNYIKFELRDINGVMWHGGGAPTWNANTTYYPAVGFTGVPTADTAATRAKVRCGGTASRLCANVLTNGVTATSTINPRDAGTNLTQVLSIGSGVTGFLVDTSHSDVLATTSEMIYEVVMGATGTTMTVRNIGMALRLVQTAAVGQASETDTAQAVVAAKRLAVGQASETDLAQPVTRAATAIPISQASETDLAQAVVAAKRLATGQASETDLAQAVVAAKRKAVAQASETDLAQGVSAPTFVPETFNSGTLPATWRDDSLGNGSYSIIAGQLVVVRGNAAETVSTPRGNLKDAEVFALVIPPGGVDHRGGIYVHNDAAQGFSSSAGYLFEVYDIGAGPHLLLRRSTNAGALTTLLDIAYDAVNHAWFRVRESAGTIYFDTSPSDGHQPTSWTNRHSEATNSNTEFTPNVVRVSFRVADGGAPAQYIFDGFNAAAGQALTIGQASETDLAQAVTWRKVVTIGQPSETDTAGAVTALKRLAVGQPEEIDEAQAVTAAAANVIGQAEETDLAQAVTAAKTLTVAQASETDSANAVTASKASAVGQAAETDLAQSVAAAKALAVGQASETDAAQAVTGAKSRAVGQTSEADTAGAVTAAKARSVGQASELDEAQAVSSSTQTGIGQPSESDTAQPVTAAKQRAVGEASETDLARPVTARKAYTVGQSSETDAAQTVTAVHRRTVGQAAEADTSRPVTHSKQKAVAQATETDLARTVVALHVYGIGIALEADLAQPITHSFRFHIGQAQEVDEALPVTVTGGLASVALIRAGSATLTIPGARSVTFTAPGLRNAQLLVGPRVAELLDAG